MSKNYHFIGIGGIGMSGLARLMLKKNFEISGSDQVVSHMTKNLQESGVNVYIGHDSRYVKPDMTVVYSTGINTKNVELMAAQQHKCQILHRSELLSHLMSEYKTLAVAGTHGKTTTSSLLTWVLHVAKQEPSFAVGGVIPQFGTNADLGRGAYFVAEADESDCSFLNYEPFGAIITNIDDDHLNYFGTLEKVIASFGDFIKKVTSPNYLLYCGDDIHLKKLNPPGIDYGFNSTCQLRAFNYKQIGWGISFDVEFQGHFYSNIEVSLCGRHNAYNALAVFGLGIMLGIEVDILKKALITFQGVGRRLEHKGEKNGILLLDDYAHHPTEIKTTLQGVREAIKERRLIVVYQPHRFTRTKDSLGSYKEIFDEADELIITDIYSAGEPPIPGITHQRIIDELNDRISVRYVSRNNLVENLRAALKPHDVLITLGAGDITKLSTELNDEFNNNRSQKYKIGLIFGGRSVEHEISLLSARNIVSGLNSDLYDVKYFAISKQGIWINGPEAQASLALATINKHSETFLTKEVMDDIFQCDILFPVLHGPFGEDGTLQGFFNVINKPFVGCDYRAGAICMDKALTKNLMIQNGIPTSPFLSINMYEWKNSEAIILSKILKVLQFPMYVKPSHLGSAVGVVKVETFADLQDAIKQAFVLDYEILVEEEIQGREIEFAIFGHDELSVFPPGEIITNGKTYDYEAKYGANPQATTVEANLPQGILDKGMELALTAYKVTGCSGLARVDFFLDSDGKFWLNEINPLPGFTKNSLYPQICAAHGIPLKKLLDKLIILGLFRKRKHRHYETAR